LTGDGEHVLAAILASPGVWTRQTLVEAATKILDDEARAVGFVDYLIDEQIIVQRGSLVDQAELIEEWSNRGWRTPAMHHLSGFGMPFMPDDRGGEDYSGIYAGMLSDPASPPQPQAVKGIPAESRHEIPVSRAAPTVTDASVQEVLENAKQVYAFDEHELSFPEVHAILVNTFMNQRYQETGLGRAVMRSYPSGGARHPLEVYLVSKRKRQDEPAGVYYFHPGTGSLYLVRQGRYVGRDLDEACFLKRGVRSSDFGVLISVRWLRHIWKYRYPRSYKMIMLEVGHALQSLTFAALSQNAESYYCPSFNDSELNDLCCLSDPFDESVGVVVSLGRNGLTLEQYRERYDTNA
jgi:SagB-type dehydrogenase family enzyme